MIDWYIDSSRKFNDGIRKIKREIILNNILG